MYGTLPIVRNVGGLADSVVDVTPETIQAGTATGFVFDDYSSTALATTVARALELYRKQDVWKKVMTNGMSQDWSWTKSAHHYVETYHKAKERRHDRHLEGRAS
jgi:starch synthase